MFSFTIISVYGIMTLMNVNQARELVAQLQEDLAAEPDPEVRAWYETETKLQPDYIRAQRTLEELAIVSQLIGQIAELKANQKSAELQTGAEDLSKNDENEEPRILSPEEVLRQRVERRYAANFKQYQTELRGITTGKRSKREHQQLIARRQFARQFCDFTDITGDANIVLRPDLLKLFSDEICDDEELTEEVFANSARYSEKHALEITANHKNFAKIIASAVEGRPRAAQYESILKAIFSTETPNLADLQLNLAHASFELLEDQEAVTEVTNIALLNKPYVPTAFATEIMKRADELMAGGNLAEAIDYMQILGIYHLLSHDITREFIRESSRLSEAMNAYKGSWEIIAKLKEQPEEYLDVVEEIAKDRAFIYDPAEAVKIDGTKTLDFGLLPASEALLNYLRSSALFRKRIDQLAPFSYSKRVAMRVFENKAYTTQHIPLSPSLTVDVHVPLKDNKPLNAEQFRVLFDRLNEFVPNILKKAVGAPNLGLSTYTQSGKLRLLYEGLFEDEANGIVVYRPSTPVDARTHSPLQRLAINYAAIRGIDALKGISREGIEEDYEKKNQELRQEIRDKQNRFLGRRPVKFPMLGELKKIAGLLSVSLRYDPKRGLIKSLIELDEGEVELELDREFNMKDTDRVAMLFPETQLYYENLILRLAKKWACAQELHTSEGVISESSGNSANMGHFAHLRVREDGRRYNFTPKQQDACLEEQGLDLTMESARRRALDSTGQYRNSTYVREFYDPNKPPLVVYYSELDSAIPQSQ